MDLSRQEDSLTKQGRANQRARTRTALLQAAAELVREGSPPSIPAAADRALVSIATAYRYFSSAEDLWWEASEVAIGFQDTEEATRGLVGAAGDDPQARLEALIRGLGFHMLENQLPYRRAAKAALDQWFRQAAAGGDGEGERAPVRQGRRNAQIRSVLAPLEQVLPGADVDRIAHALGLVVAVEAVISLSDAVGLDVPTAKQSLLDAGRWLLAGALAELTDPGPS